MTKKGAVDGFIPRRSPGIIGSADVDRKLPPPTAQPLRRRQPVALNAKQPGPAAEKLNSLVPVQQHGLTRADIDQSLQDIDDQSAKDSPHHKRGGVKSRRRKLIKRAILILLALLVAFGLVLAVRALISSRSVFKGDIFGLVQQKKLKQDAGGRTNVLVVGTSEDDPGHEGAHLTDSIMVLSVDQTNKNAYMVSIPRDLPVKYGMACNAGYAGKINEFFNCVNQDWTSESAENERQTEMRRFVGDILGIEVQYSAHVNYSVMRDVVGALGGITVNIESTDPRGQMDGNFDWKCGDTYAKRMKNCPPRGHFIDYPNGPANLDAEHALYLAQARGDTAVQWGFDRSNFDREQNQQKIIKAIKEKGMSSGTLSNPIKVSGLIDAIGKNLRTNFDTSEIGTLVSLAQNIPSDSLVSLDLQKDEIMGGDAIPVAGLYNFTQLQSYLKKKLYATGITKESPHVVVLNASGVAGAAQVEADKLSALGMDVDAVGNAPTGEYKTNVVYQIGKTAKSQTATKLSELYGTKPQVVESVPGVTLADTTNYVIVLLNANTSATGNTSAEE